MRLHRASDHLTVVICDGNQPEFHSQSTIGFVKPIDHQLIIDVEIILSLNLGTYSLLQINKTGS